MNKFILVISLFILASVQQCWSHQDSLLNARIDSLVEVGKSERRSEVKVDVIKTKDVSQSSDSKTSCCKKKNSMKSDDDGWMLLWTLLSPVLLAIIGGIIAIWQIRVSSKLTLDQTRANSISDARIEWMQKFRNLMSEFLSEVAALNYYLRGVIELAEDKEKEKAKEEYEKTIERRIKVRRLGTEIVLMLNVNETKHLELDELIEKFLNVTTEDHKKIKEFSQYENLSKAIQEKSRDILKEVWEQAKNEGKDEGVA